MCTAIVVRQRSAKGGFHSFIGFNRDERYDRPATLPEITDGEIPFLAPGDLRSKGTWIGLNRCGLCVALINSSHSRYRGEGSRGALVQSLLSSAQDVPHAIDILESTVPHEYSASKVVLLDNKNFSVAELGPKLGIDRYPSGVTVLCDADRVNQKAKRSAWLSGNFRGNETFEPTVGRLAAVLREHRSCSRRWYTTCCHSPISGTVSSQIIALHESPDQSRFLHSDGAPCMMPYQEYVPF